MTSRAGLRLLALALAAALLAPGVAHAERITLDDAVGDVVERGYDLDQFVSAPDNQSADITRTVVDHRAGVLTVALSVRDLVDTTYDFLLVRIRTPRRVYDVLVERRGRHTFTTWSGRSGPTCGSAWTSADSIDDRIVVRVPTDCIGTPRSARIAVGLIDQVVTHDPQTGDSMVTFIDDAFAPDASRLDNGVTYGPEVRRG